MAKDPAFLFYPGDWLGGTMGMTYEEKGAYLELLVMQWNCHRITKDAATRLVGNDLWQKISGKFSKDENGFFNKRLEEEVVKRRKHSDKQKDNANKRWNKPLCDGIANAMPLENENRNESIKELKGEISEIEINSTIEFCSITLQRKYDNKRIADLFKAFLIQNGKDSYFKNGDRIKHFRNWIKLQPYEKSIKKEQSSSAAPLTKL